jgi:hypothetical protein
VHDTGRRHLRAAFLVVLVISAGTIAVSFATAKENIAASQANTSGTFSEGPTGTLQMEQQLNRSDVDDSGQATGTLTVVTTQGFYVSDEQAELVAFSGSGDIVYYDDSYRVYFDVDPVADRRHTVDYLASKHLEGEDCEAYSSDRCTYNVYTRVNLSTGEEREIYGEVTPRIYSARWHDIDWYNETHLVVADIGQDSVRLVEADSEETTWRWNATEHYNRSQGGKAGDWTHVNDVEVLADGTIMASMRNMDQVIFLAPGEGVDANRSLGADDDHDVLHEQHNPDYIPADEGGPAVLVGDSENGRIVEYQREGDDWVRSWTWRDNRLQWPRDADRLPSNHTLVVDSHGDRVVEVAPNGSVVWSVTIGMPYDVERLGTGDESTGGQSMQAIQATSEAETVETTPGPVDRFWLTLKDATPSLVANGLLYSAPSWMRFTDLAFASLFLLVGLVWGGSEVYWSNRRPLTFVRAVTARLF